MSTLFLSKSIDWQLSYARAGVGAPMVLLHGIGGGATTWSGQVAALSDAFDVLAWDMPGYGRSTMLAVDSDEREYAQRLWAWLGTMGLTATPIHLVAQSLGAVIAACAAVSQPKRVASLTLLSPALGYGLADPAVRREKHSQRIRNVETFGMEAFAAQRAAAMLGAPTPEKIEAVRAVMAAIPAPAYIAATHLLTDSDLATHLADVRCPITIAAGRKDAITPVEQCKALAQHHRALFVTLDDAGHASTVDAPDLINALLRSAA